MKFAYFVRPHLGGTYSVYLNLRTGLKKHGIELQWVGLERPPASEGPFNEISLNDGSFVFANAAGCERARAATLIEALEREHFDGVFINVLAEQMQMNIARYLPNHIMRIMIVHTITPATYAAALAIRDSVHATVAVCERARRDLVARHGFSPRWTRTIDNAIALETVSALKRAPKTQLGLKLLFLGRVEDTSKGVLWLPRIMNRVAPSTTLTVAGDGPDQAELRKRLARFHGRVEFLGSVPRDRVPDLLAVHDALIMPSRFEGSPVTLIESMAAGCVPVASRISGVTDRIVMHGISGLLFPTGNWRQAAREIGKLETQPQFLGELSLNARLRAKADFSVDRMALAYAKLIEEVRLQRPSVANPLLVKDWAVPNGFRPGLRAYMPRPVKNWLRVVLTRL